MQIIVNKAGLYGTIRAKSGDVLEMPDAYARVWIALKRASEAYPKAKVPRQPAEPFVPATTIFDKPDAETISTEDEASLKARLPAEGTEGDVGADNAVGAVATKDVGLNPPAVASAAGESSGTVVTPESEAGGDVVDAEAAEIKAARADYEAAFGKKPFMGWKADQLREKIAEKKDED